jgi:hypothetical protein
MNRMHRRRVALFLAAAALAPLSQAQAAGCAGAGASPLTLGTVAPVAPGAARTFTLAIGPRQGVIVDLVAVTPAASSDDDDEHEEATATPRALRLCDGQGNVLAPQPGEVFVKGGSVTAIDEGERLKFYANAAGPYLISVAAGDTPREILVRRRDVGTVQAPVISATLGAAQKGVVSSKAPMVFGFTAAAGQWVEIKSTSEKDTLLRLAAPDREGDHAVIAENDDGEGLNPVLRRRLPIAGTYYVQVDSLSEEPGEFTLTLERTDAPKPPPPPIALRAGATVTGKLADGDAVAVYALPVAAGRSYRLELSAEYDGVVAIGVPNPVEPDDGGSGADVGFTEIKAQDSGTTGTEKLTFTARGAGQILVRVKSFGIGETDGAFTLKAIDLGA